MKNGALLFAVFNAGILLSQDSIYTRAGEIITSKVVEVNDDQIKYRKPSNLDGPLYVINKYDVDLIRYENGSKDLFSESYANSETCSNPRCTSHTTRYYYPNNPQVNVNIVPVPYFGFGFPYYIPVPRPFYRPYVHVYRHHGYRHAHRYYGRRR